MCAGALGIGCVIFMVLALGSIAAFGPAVNSNILNNLSATGMTPLIGAAPAAVSGWGHTGDGCLCAYGKALHCICYVVELSRTKRGGVVATWQPACVGGCCGDVC